MGKIHFTINPPCKVSARWGSSQISSTRNVNDVTCERCLRSMKKGNETPQTEVSHGYTNQGMGTMTKFTGLFDQRILDCQAATEEEAQAKLKARLIQMIQADQTPFIIWDVPDDDPKWSDDCKITGESDT